MPLGKPKDAKTAGPNLIPGGAVSVMVSYSLISAQTAGKCISRINDNYGDKELLVPVADATDGAGEEEKHK